MPDLAASLAGGLTRQGTTPLHPTEATAGKRLVAKNKCAPPFCEAEFEIRWGHGIDAIGELIDLGLARGLVDKAGNHLAFGRNPLGDGRERARETLASSAELQSTLCQATVASGGVEAGKACGGGGAEENGPGAARRGCRRDGHGYCDRGVMARRRPR
jgi:hypothetical protein